MISKRIKVLSSFISANDIVLDVGCDHGYLSIYLKENNLCKDVYASDVLESALSVARKNIKERNLDIKTFISNGFNEIDVVFNTAVVAGMGGQVIADIIEHPFAKTKLVLQPMKDSDILFEKLCLSGFKIEKEVIVREGGRFYEIILACPGTEKPFDFSLPKMDVLLKNEDALLFLKHKKTVLQKALKGSQNAVSEEGKLRLNELNEKIKMIDEVIVNAYGK